MSILLKIEAKRGAVNKRLEAAQHHMATILEEKQRLDHAFAVVTDVLKEDGTGAREQNDPTELSVPKLVTMILGKSPRPLRAVEIREIAQDEHEREISPGSVHAALSYLKKAGNLTNSDGMWSIASKSETASEDAPPEASSLDGQNVSRASSA